MPHWIFGSRHRGITGDHLSAPARLRVTQSEQQVTFSGFRALWVENGLTAAALWVENEEQYSTRELRATAARRQTVTSCRLFSTWWQIIST